MINKKIATYVILGTAGLVLAAGPGIRQFNTLFPASNAILRNVADKLNDNISTKDFGALCNGSHDDTNAMNAALNYLGATIPNSGGNSGGRVTSPVGTCIVNSTIVIPQQVDFFGSGRGTFFVPSATFPINTPLFCLGPCSGSGVTAGASIQNLSIAGPLSGTPITGMTDIYSQTCEENCFVKNVLIGGAITGISFQSYGVQNSALEDLTIYPSSGGNCITIANTTSRIHLNRITCQGVGATVLPVGIQLTNATVALDNVHVEEATIDVQVTGGFALVDNSWFGPNYNGGVANPYTCIKTISNGGLIAHSIGSNPGATTQTLVNDGAKGTVTPPPMTFLNEYVSVFPGYSYWSTDPSLLNYFALLAGNHIRAYGELAVGANGANDNLFILGNDTHRSFIAASDHGVWLQKMVPGTTETLVNGSPNGIVTPGVNVVTIAAVPSNLLVGSVVTIDNNALDQESTTVTAISGSTFTASFTYQHNQGFTVTVLPNVSQGGLHLLGNNCGGDKSSGFISAGAETDGCTPTAESLTPTQIAMSGGIIHLRADTLATLGNYTATDVMTISNTSTGTGTGTVTIPSLHSITGTRYICINTSGVLVSSTTACSGT